jgi:hypothetical protein
MTARELPVPPPAAARVSWPGMTRLTTWLLALALTAAPAAACPVCDTGTGRQVRHGIVDDQFGFNLLATLLPFPFLIGIAALIHFGWPGRK